MSLTPKEPGYFEPSYIDYYAQELGNGAIIELRYRLFPGFPALSLNEAEAFLTQLTELSLVPLNHRYFAVLDPYTSRNLRLVTDLEKVLSTAGRLNALTPRYIRLDTEEKWTYLPPYSPKGAPIGEEIRVTMDFSLDCMSGNGLEQRVKEAHMELKPYAWLSSPTPGEFEYIQLPYNRFFVVFDPNLKQNTKKPPITIGTERLPVVCLGLEGYKEQVESLLQQQFSSWRKCKADENRYFRCVGTAYLEGLLRIRRTDLLQALLTRISEQEDYFIWEGLEDHHYYFHYRLAPFLQEFAGDKAIVREFQPLLEDCAFDMALNGVVRNLAAFWLYRNSDAVAYLGGSVEETVQSLLVSEKTAGDMAFLAVSSALQITVNHITAGEEGFQVFSPVERQSWLEVNLILRPGNCDILYKATEDQQDQYDSFTGQFY